MIENTNTRSGDYAKTADLLRPGHAALQDYPDVTTYSTGTEPGRRIVVAYSKYRSVPDED